jgi:nucleotide sugar dehydrogenase
MRSSVSIIGLGFVGSSMFKSFNIKQSQGINIQVTGYDKFKNGGIGTMKACMQSEIAFLCLPTVFDSTKGEYDKSCIHDVCEQLKQHNYTGIVVIKSTVEPKTTNALSDMYPTLKFVHNPEFLTARTAFEDFHNQTHIVLGRGGNCSDKDMESLASFYKTLYQTAGISMCSCLESESMKIFCNVFYAAKVQFFTEFYLLCKSNGCNYDIVKNMMLKNNWINSMHTTVPGPDGNISYGGLCFPKDTNALLKYMEKQDCPHALLSAVIQERNSMRADADNCVGTSKNSSTTHSSNISDSIKQADV